MSRVYVTKYNTNKISQIIDDLFQGKSDSKILTEYLDKIIESYKKGANVNYEEYFNELLLKISSQSEEASYSDDLDNIYICLNLLLNSTVYKKTSKVLDRDNDIYSLDLDQLKNAFSILDREALSVIKEHLDKDNFGISFDEFIGCLKEIKKVFIGSDVAGMKFRIENEDDSHNFLIQDYAPNISEKIKEKIEKTENSLSKI